MLINHNGDSLPDDMDAEAAMMLKEIFKKFEDRPNTTQCLRMKFIANHSLPIMLPASTMAHVVKKKSDSGSVSVGSVSSQTDTATTENNNFHSFDTKVRAEFSLSVSSKNLRYAMVVKTIYQIFDTLCRSHDVS